MRTSQSGVTLIELMTVMVVIAILGAIAMPAYRNYVIRANRTDAKTTLMATAGALERCYTQFNSYDPDDGCPLTFPIASPNSYYQITAPEQIANKFELLATPQGTQAQDTGCGNLTLDSTNKRGQTGSKPVEECWGR